MVELIADGFHLHPRVIAMAVAAAGPDRVALVTDAMAAAGMPDGDFDLGTLHVAVRNAQARLVEPDGSPGSIAGSTLTMDAAFALMVGLGYPIPEVATMAATTPARWHGLDRVGELAPGYRADLCVVEDRGSAAARDAGRHLDRRQREREHLMLAGLREVLDPAVDAGTGIGAFNVICLEHAEGVIWGAEAANLPVVLQVSENAVLYHRSLEPILIATVALARNADIPAVVHLDHVTDPDLVRAGVELGATSVMFDGSRRSYEENVAVTADVVRYCHARNVQVEAELGEVGGKDGVHSSARSDPARGGGRLRRRHRGGRAGRRRGQLARHDRADAKLDLELVERLRQAVDVPLVLHGSSGVPDDELVRAIRAGLTKINIGTHLNAMFTRSVRRNLDDQPRLVDPRRYLGPARDDVATEVERLLRARCSTADLTGHCLIGREAVQGLLALGRVVDDRLRVARRARRPAPPRVVQVLVRHVGQLGHVAADVAPVAVELLGLGESG